MECFVVFFNDFHGKDEFVDVFATREGAQEYINKLDDFERSSFRIVPWVMGS